MQILNIKRGANLIEYVSLDWIDGSDVNYDVFSPSPDESRLIMFQFSFSFFPFLLITNKKIKIIIIFPVLFVHPLLTH